MKKKFLFIINSLGKGGAERVVINLVNKLAEMNYLVVIVVFNEEISYDVNKNIEIIKIEGNKKKSKYLNIFNNVKELNRIISTKKEQGIVFDVITSHLPYCDLVTRLSVCKNEVIHVIHGPFSMYHKKFKMLLKIILKIIYNSTNIVAVSDGVKNELLNQYNVKPKKIKTIYNPLDINKIKEEKNRDINIKEKYLLFCGRLDYIKRPLMAIDIFYKGEFYKDYKLVYIGDGILKDDIRKYSEKYNISNRVEILGWQENVYKWMNKSELLINTSEIEAFSMVIVEALASNCKVVSFDCNYGPREIMTGDLQKYLVENGDIEDYIQKINLSLNSYPKNLEEIIGKFNIKYIIQEYLNF